MSQHLFYSNLNKKKRKEKVPPTKKKNVFISPRPCTGVILDNILKYNNKMLNSFDCHIKPFDIHNKTEIKANMDTNCKILTLLGTLNKYFPLNLFIH